MVEDTEVIETWKDTVPKELRFSNEGKDRLERFDDPGGLAKSYIELEQRTGTMVNVPGENSTDEQKAEFYAKLGRPEKPEGYEIARPENLPEGLPYDEVLEGKIKQVAHGAGVTQSQLAALAKVFNDYGVETFNTALEANKKLNDERWANLKMEWGENKTKENIELAKRAFDEIAPKELKDIMTRDEVESDPILVKMYAGIWRRNLSDSLVRGTPAPGAPEKEYVPTYPDSPEMYRYGDDEDSVKAREYFKKRGHTY